jgi:hypothetical protein
MTRFRYSAAAAVVVLFSSVARAFAQQPAAAPAEDVTALAKKTQNPVGDLISVPFQFNFNTGGGLQDETLFNLNIQPVIPFKLNDDWNVIARTIIPINSVPAPNGTSRYSGVGDIQEQLFVTPSAPGSIIWGIGPVLSLPTGTVTGLETGSWGLGPAAVVLKMTGPWVLGGLLTQTWTIAHSDTYTKINQLLFQPFVNYNFGQGWALSFSPIITANWEATSGNQWTVPLGLGITRTTVFDGRPMNIGVQYYYNVERPDSGPGQQIRFQIALLYPTRK